MANPTPGQWRASRHCVYAGDKMIATGCIVDVKDHDERSANLILMAAAPDLLKALVDAPILSKYNDAESFIEAYEQWRDNLKMLAIRKATTKTL